MRQTAELPVTATMSAMRFITVMLATVMTSLVVKAAPPIYKCNIGGSITYQSDPCPSTQPRVQPTPDKLNNEQQKRKRQAAESNAQRSPQSTDTSETTRRSSSDAAPESRKTEVPPPAPIPTDPKPRFACDGRTYCSQMRSCAEAKYYLANCPNVKMDGNHDGIPCERQWCN